LQDFWLCHVEAFGWAGVLNSRLHSLFSDLKNIKTLLLAFKGNNVFARKTTHTKKTDYIQNGYVDSELRRKPPSSWTLFALPQYQIHEAADEGESKGHPGEDEGVAEAAARGLGIQFFVLLVNVFAPVCVNGSCDHDTQACWKKARAQINHRPQCATGDPRGLWSELKTNFRFYY